MAQEGMASGFTSRQKLMAGVFIVIVIVLIWQVIGMFGNSVDTTTISKVSPPQPAKPGMQPMQQGMSTTTPGMPSQQPIQQPQPIQPLKGQTTPNNELLKKQQEAQQQYISTVNSLQMLKLQKDIAETNQAISAAKLATATAEKNISDLLIKPATPAQASVPIGEYANKLLTPIPAGSGQPVQGPPAPAAVVYTVISVSMEFNRWTAVIGNQGKLYHVSVGDVLPMDGSVVVSIGRDGIVLIKDNVKRKISLVPVI